MNPFSLTRTPEHSIRRALRNSGMRRVVTRFRHRALDPEDVFLASYPRSGNHWVRFVLMDLVTGTDRGFEDADELMPYVGEHLNGAKRLPGGLRIIKTHEPYRSYYRRAVYLIRDPRDVALSYSRWLSGFGVNYASLDSFLSEFMKGKIGGYGPWIEHAAEWIEAAAGSDDIIVVRYEDLRSDPLPELGRVAEVAGIPASEERIELAAERNSADIMRQKASDESAYFEDMGWRDPSMTFVGAATAGGWRDRLNEEQLAILEPATSFYLDLD